VKSRKFVFIFNQTDEMKVFTDCALQKFPGMKTEMKFIKWHHPFRENSAPGPHTVLRLIQFTAAAELLLREPACQKTNCRRAKSAGDQRAAQLMPST
jgi:hypothetical protein